MQVDKPVRRRVSRPERERQILDAASAVFAERGYQAASMDAVAERVGVTKPVLYDHFGSKEGLLLACIARARTELLEVTTEAAAGATNPEGMLRNGFRAFFDFLDSRGAASTLLYEEAAKPVGSAAEALEGIRNQQTGFIVGLLAAHAPDADARRLEAYAQVIVGASERLALWRGRRGGHDTVTAEQATEFLMDLVWSGLATAAVQPG
ncbi:MAG TPA: TetR/AcrR family transcriptional regulator [Pseudonocardia sp.]|jgi:AcrR family transcriptional regulator|uniref:TetR/AcrR family transcriptional regulator n=1 Tax=Pseudonocardia sp. TaxID=60912 RepID=UPI002C4E906F|nr:TetR/AcrR family transcriptional regulator [Pseudonocardia sp.]HTF50901.1 TetR/AcrR family transcriptional regulator [Pseudonocardia sp.]